MKTNYYNRCSYSELLAAATAPAAKQIDVDTLGAWFEQYGNTYWNGEYYDANGVEIWPVYKEVSGDEFELSGYRIK